MFRSVILPLAIPGIFAAFLLTFVPAVGDYVNAQILGGTSNTMIGNVIQNEFLMDSDYPAASALSAILLAVDAGRHLRLRASILGSSTIEEYVVSTTSRTRTSRRGRGRRAAQRGAHQRRWTRYILPTYSALVIAVPADADRRDDRVQLQRVALAAAARHLQAGRASPPQWYREWNQIPGLTPAFFLSLQPGVRRRTIIAAVIGTLLALALVRYRFRGKGVTDQVMFMNIAAPEIVLGAALLGFFITINIPKGFLTLFIAHVMFSIAYVDDHGARAAGRVRPLDRAGGAATWGRRRGSRSGR